MAGEVPRCLQVSPPKIPQLSRLEIQFIEGLIRENLCYDLSGCESIPRACRAELDEPGSLRCEILDSHPYADPDGQGRVGYQHHNCERDDHEQYRRHDGPGPTGSSSRQASVASMWWVHRYRILHPINHRRDSPSTGEIYLAAGLPDVETGQNDAITPR